MIYREFKKGKIKVSSLGFGAMRFPTIKNEGDIDVLKTEEMLDYAMENGVNYIDTAYPYHEGMSEPFLGHYIEKRKIREKIYLATKMPVWLVKKKEDLDFYFNAQLNRLRTDYIDFYLLHSLWKKSWEKVRDLGVIDWLINKKKEGKIRFFGFSFHDEFPVFKDIVDYYDWDFAQIQLNYMDVDYQAGEKGLSYAYKKGIQVIIMEPIKGGKLANPPERVLKVLSKFRVKRTPVEWALSFVLNKKEVLTVLSGMSALEHVKENIRIASKYDVGCLAKEEEEILKKAREEWMKIKFIDCTNCKYCLPCPFGVNIQENFEIYNEALRYNDFKEGKYRYEFLKEEERASNCKECGECESKCPQNLSIIELLKLVDEAFR
ncbi:MAG: aldo/keto reductase [Caldiserica bacterium]|nr:MAG: aldo/keto reductase [Caldisericota bacterium]